MFKIQISNTIIESPTLSTRAFYLYVYLKLYARDNKKIYIYNSDLKKLTKISDNKTIKERLNELRSNKFIYYELPINKETGEEKLPNGQPLVIDFVDSDYIAKTFNQISDEALFKIQELTCKLKVGFKKNKQQYEKIVNAKEVATRLYYVYEMKYIKKDNNPLRISFEQIKSIVGSNNETIIAINKTLIQNNLLKQNTGDKIESSNQRYRNKYYPLWEEWKPNIDNIIEKHSINFISNKLRTKIFQSKQNKK